MKKLFQKLLLINFAATQELLKANHLERIKTNLQAGKSLSSAKGWSATKSSSEKGTKRLQRQLKLLADFFHQYFRGCLTKSMHATSSSFCYFSPSQAIIPPSPYPARHYVKLLVVLLQSQIFCSALR